jgi:hypothetical protein
MLARLDLKNLLRVVFAFIFVNMNILSYEGVLTYQKLIRLNTPLYHSNAGDWLDLSYTDDAPISQKKLDSFLKGEVRLYFEDNNTINYSLQEAYYRYLGETYTLTVGRKILDWNTNEKYWMLGYLNGNQAFTLLSDEEEGLAGILYNKKYYDFDFDIFLSYLFIPQLNPGVTFKNGKVESHSEWMRMPPRATIVNGSAVPIYYKVKDINYAKILLNKSFGFNLKYKWRNGGLAAFVIYKPENKLRINAEAYYDNITLNQVVAEADPTVNHHAYFGLQLFQEFGDVKVRGGISYVDPNASIGKDIPVFEIKNSRTSFDSPYFKVSPQYTKEAYTHMSANLSRQKYDLSVNYIHLISGKARKADDFFSDTVKWKRAFGFRATYYITDAFSIMADLKYDIARFDNILKGELKYNYNKKVYVSLGLEMLKAPDDTLYLAAGLYF